MVTLSGLVTDETQNVLTTDWKPIKGLYAAGNCLGGRYGFGYSTPFAGNSVGMAMTHGLVGRQDGGEFVGAAVPHDPIIPCSWTRAFSLPKARVLPVSKWLGCVRSTNEPQTARDRRL